MRLVRFDSQERVDLPDLTAVSFLVLGEFRRTVRNLLLGPGTGAGTHDTSVIRGYLTEPSAVPDAIVTVRLVPTTGGGRPLSAAIGGEDLGSRIDFGQLMGGEDMAGATEGNASSTFDFTGQPNATYLLQMRFVYQDGANDNRAFWNENLKSEFVNATNTRTAPAIELAIAVSPALLGDEYIALATVVWDGASIDAADISDARTLTFEGQAGSFDGATQAASPMDFDRSTDRGIDGVNSIYPVLRALARQIADLKGPDTAANYNWYARVARPFDDTNDTLPATQTKSITSVDTTTYTIGDGTTTFGDFNGLAGLETCLQHLEDLGTQVPEHVRIVLKSNAAAGFEWAISTPHTLGSTSNRMTLELVGRGAGGTAGPTLIDFTGVTAGTTALFVWGKLVLDQVGNGDAVELPVNATMFMSTTIDARGCRFLGRETEGASAVPAIRMLEGGRFSRLESCEWGGVIRVEDDTVSGFGSSLPGGVIDSCWTDNGCLEFQPADPSAASLTRGWLIQNCRVRMAETHGWGLRGAIDLGNCPKMTVRDSQVFFVTDVDGIHTRRISSTSPTDLVVSECIFDSLATVPTHAIDGGGNGANGTGWAVYVDGTGGSAFGIQISGCRIQTTALDAGGIRVNACEAPVIENTSVTLGGANATASSRYDCIYLGGSARAKVLGCDIGRWNSGADARTSGIQVDASANVTIAHCTLDARTSADGTVTGRGAAHSAVYLTGGANTVNNLAVHDCQFIGWELGTDINRCIVDAATGSDRLKVEGNTFESNGGYCVDFDGATDCKVDGNIVSVGGTGRGFTMAAAPNTTCVGNNITITGAARTVIDWGAASTNLCASNRLSGGGTINVASGIVWGVSGGGGPTNLNYLT
jgi:hypothetical protein